MSEFTRHNTLVLNAKFTALPGDASTPSAAEARLVYRDLAGSEREEVIPLTLDTDGVTWTCTWDSGNSGPGRVEWSARCWGGLQAATQGSFNVKANSANRD